MPHVDEVGSIDDDDADGGGGGEDSFLIEGDGRWSIAVVETMIALPLAQAFGALSLAIVLIVVDEGGVGGVGSGLGTAQATLRVEVMAVVAGLCIAASDPSFRVSFVPSFPPSSFSFLDDDDDDDDDDE